MESRPKIRRAGDGIPKAARRAKPFDENLPRDGQRREHLGSPLSVDRTTRNLTELNMPDGKISRLVFGKAANTPFGTVSKADEGRIGRVIKDHIYGNKGPVRN
jgi:hypothetical protein